MDVLNFAKASPFSTAVIRLSRRCGVFFNKKDVKQKVSFTMIDGRFWSIKQRQKFDYS